MGSWQNGVMIKLLCSLSVAALLSSASPAQAQPDANPFTGMTKSSWDSLKAKLSASAAKMSEADYAFKPTPEVRSFGQIVGHLANDHYLFCAGARGEKNPSTTDYEKTTSKAALVEALDKSIAYCDSVFASMTDATGTQQVELFGQKFLKLGALQVNVAHSSEHYGNLVTYMRLKGVVPPSSTGQ